MHLILVQQAQAYIHRLSNLKRADFIYQTNRQTPAALEVSRETVPATLIANVGTYVTRLKPYTMRNLAVNFQTKIPKACADWVVYCSSVTDVWGFFLFSYFIALFFFFYFIVPKSIPHYRLNTNPATRVSGLSSFISCGIPFSLIFTILYESTYLLFTNENFPAKTLHPFLIESRQ